MDVLATYGPMVVGALICGAISIVACILWELFQADRDDLDYSAPPPWETVLTVTIVAAPAVAFVGAAALIGPSSDLGNFGRAVGGVLIGLTTYLAIQGAARGRVPRRLEKRLSDGRVLTGTEAERYFATRPGLRHWEAGWEFALFVCILPPVAGVLVALLVADWH